MDEKISVRVRVKPCQASIISLSQDSSSHHTTLQLKSNTFSFDTVYPADCSQIDIFQSTIQTPLLIDRVLDGLNACILCYGQTGSGKTHTIQGVLDHPDAWGLMPRCFEEVFERVRQRGGRYLIRCCYLELYNEEWVDLLYLSSAKHRQELEKRGMKLVAGPPVPDSKETQQAEIDVREREDGSVYVRNACEYIVTSKEDLMALMMLGNKRRTTASTAMNSQSSRSHAIFTITIESKQPNQNKVTVGKMNLVDLAGSERQKRAQTTGQRFVESTKINLSLSALGHVINSIVDQRPHIPYRDSKLTRMLQDAIGGNSVTIMIACVSSDDSDMDESLNTLRYAQRAKQIKNKPRVNQAKNALVDQFDSEILQLLQQQSDHTDPELARMKEELESEREKISESTAMAEQEKQRLLQDLNVKLQELNKERTRRTEIQVRLKSLQDSLVMGGINLLDQAALHEKELAQKKDALARTRVQQQQLEKEIEEVDLKQFEIEKHYSSLKEEVEARNTQLKALWATMQSLKNEIFDMETVHEKERQELADELKSLMAEFNMKRAILKQFVPDTYLDHIIKQSQFNSDKEMWVLPSSITR